MLRKNHLWLIRSKDFFWQFLSLRLVPLLYGQEGLRAFANKRAAASALLMGSMPGANFDDLAVRKKWLSEALAFRRSRRAEAQWERALFWMCIESDRAKGMFAVVFALDRSREDRDKPPWSLI